MANFRDTMARGSPPTNRCRAPFRCDVVRPPRDVSSEIKQVDTGDCLLDGAEAAIATVIPALQGGSRLRILGVI